MTFNSRDGATDSAKINGNDKNSDDSAANAYQHFRSEISQSSSDHNSADTAKFMQAVTKHLVANNILPDCVIAGLASGAAPEVRQRGRESEASGKEQATPEKKKENHESNDEKHHESNDEKSRPMSDSSKEHEHHADHDSKAHGKHHPAKHHGHSHPAPNLVLDSSSTTGT
jgi:hypothetical protein